MKTWCGSWWREQSMGGWNAFILDSFLPQRRKLKRITQYGCVVNFLRGNKPLEIHTGDFLDVNNPHLHCWENTFVSPISFCPKRQIPASNWNLSSNVRKGSASGRREKSVRLLFFLNRADTATNDRLDKYDPSPQTTVLWSLQSMRRRAIWLFDHKGQPKISLNTFNRRFKSTL